MSTHLPTLTDAVDFVGRHGFGVSPTADRVVFEAAVGLKQLLGVLAVASNDPPEDQ